MAIIKSGASSDQWTIDAASKAGRVSLYDTAGNPIDATPGIDGGYHIETTMVQEVYASTKNSSTSQINNGATWTGDAETTLGIAGIQVNVFANQWLTITVQQSVNGSDWDYVSRPVIVPASTSFNRTYQAVGSYYRLVVANTSGSNATTVRIQTALCPVVECLPAELSPGGELRTTTRPEWEPYSGSNPYMVSTFRTLGVAASTQNIFTIENPSASLYNIAVRNINVISDTTNALNTITPQIQLSRSSGLPSGGTVLTSTKFKTADPSPQAVTRGGTASDGGGATAITATAGPTMWQQYLDRPHTAVGWFTHPQYNLLPELGSDLRHVILLPGEALLVQGVTSIANTTHIIVQCTWSEYLAK